MGVFDIVSKRAGRRHQSCRALREIPRCIPVPSGSVNV